MANPPKSAPQGATTRAEKLSILSAMLGPDALARVREGQPDLAPQTPQGGVEIDADRAEWHRNRLLERLRKQSNSKLGQTDRERTPSDAFNHAGLAPKARPSIDSQRVFGAGNASLDARLAMISDAATLGQEHPAIIARLVKTLSRDERVEALKSLPGPVARSIVRRLR